MPNNNPTGYRPSPTREPVFFSLKNDPYLSALILHLDRKHLVRLIQTETDSVISAATADGNGVQARALRNLQLVGMLELLKALVAVEFPVPSMLEVVVRGEMRRVSQ
jgi:hypothetical protein